MTNFWLLPFGLIGFWIAVGVVELIRTPKPPGTRDEGINRQPRPINTTN